MAKQLANIIEEAVMQHLNVQSGDITLSAYTWGTPPTTGNPKQVVLMLHGFPDRAQLWKATAEYLANDHYVIAFDMRGCGESTPIKGRQHYRYEALVNDVYAVIYSISPHQKVHLVGHDWGGLYGWEVIYHSLANEKIASFTTMAPSLDHVGLFLRKRYLRPTPRNLIQMFDQLRRNALMMFFTLPVLPEVLWRSGLGTWMMRRMVEGYEGVVYLKNEGVEDDAIRYLGIYRSNLLQRTLLPRRLTSSIPVHAVMALQDPFLPPTVFEQCEHSTGNYCSSELTASHWAPLSRFQELAEVIRSMSQANAAV
jgi:pimeloyl-ACP methyl ester carboxylesterase